MRLALLAASVAAVALANGASSVWAAPQAQTAAATATAPDAQAAASTREPAAALRATSPPNADPARTYEQPSGALLAADLDYLVRRARTETATGDQTAIWPVLVFSDELASNRLREARTALEHAQGGVHGSLADLMEPFLLAAEGRVDFGVERVDHGSQDLPAPLPDVQRALVFESAGRLNEAAAIYSQMEERLDLSPPSEGEPANIEEFQRTDRKSVV